MRTLAIGDIHGCSLALDTLLAAVNLRPGDCIITLGDYVDRGPDSYGVLERLLALRQTYELIALRGNHDQMMLDARDSGRVLTLWLQCGGSATLESYTQSGDLAEHWCVPARHWQFLENDLIDWYETETHFFVHGNVDAQLPLTEQPRHQLLWESVDGARPHISGKVMICGHTAQHNGLPLHLGHAICLDTWVYGNGWLTCLEVKTGKVWQANQRGQTRLLGWIDEPEQ
jgi:serine/threonine protein phosphatase 1